MFKFIKGCNIEKFDELKEGFTIENNTIRSNVNADKILKLMKDFIKKQGKTSRLFLFIEVPSNLNDEALKKGETEDKVGILEETHVDIYYIDNIPQQVALEILDSAGDILINDGLVNFGFGNHLTGDEIGKYKYNEIYVHCKEDIKKYEKLFKNNKIEKFDNLISPWNLINKDNPGTSEIYIKDGGMDIYDLIKVFEDSFEEFYKAEKRVE